MLEPADIELLESGCALISGYVRADGAPFAGRGWGLSFAADGRTGRLLVPPRDLALLGRPDDDVTGTWIAVTGAHVLTLESRQVKGRVLGVGPATEADLEHSRRYCDDYFAKVFIIDDVPRHLMERMVPNELVALTFTVEEAFDQTPGPRAGRTIGGVHR